MIGKGPGALALLALLAVSASGAGAGGWSTKLVIDDGVLDPREPTGEWTGKRLSFADVDGDGDLEILAHNENKRAYAIDAWTGRARVEVSTRYPYGPDLGPFNGVVAADLDDDGKVEMVVVNRAAVVSAFTLEGDGLKPRLLWDKHLKELHGKPTADAAGVLADLDADGKLDVMTQTEERGTYALRADGTLLWKVDEYGGNAEPVAHDVDNDGDLDAVVFTDGGVVYAVDGADGTTLWRYDAQRIGVWPGSIASAGIVDDIDNDGKVEVVACARNVEDATPDYAPGAPHYRQHHFVLFAVREGKLLWSAKPSWGNPLCSAYLVAHDVDGDGKKEIFGMDWNTIGHKPGGWERLGPANAFSYSSSGRERWHVALNAWDAKPPFAMLDADGDGDQDLLAYDRGALVGLDAGTGEVTARVGLGGGLVQQGPVIANVDGKGAWRVVVAVTMPDRLYVFEPPRQTEDPAWPGWDLPARPKELRRPTPPPAPTPTPTPPTPTPGATATPPETSPTLSPTPTPSSPSPPAPEAAAEIPGPAALLLVLACSVASALRNGQARGRR